MHLSSWQSHLLSGRWIHLASCLRMKPQPLLALHISPSSKPSPVSTLSLHEQLWGDPVPICRYSTCNFFSEPYDNKLPHCCRFTFKHFRVCFLQNRTFSHIPIVHTSQSQDTPTDALTSSSPETEYGSGVEYLKLCVSHMPYQTLIYSLAYIRMDSCLLCSPHGF